MSGLPVEIIEPDPSATSLSNDETVNKAGGDQSAPTETNVEMTDAKPEEVKENNGSAEVKKSEESEKVEEKVEEKTEEKIEEKTEVKAEEKIEEAAVKNEKPERQNGHNRGEFKKHYDNNRGPPRNYNKGPNNSKYDPSVLESTDDHKQIRAQVEFYFGDANLPTDQFLWEKTDGASNLPVSIETICKFGRMKRFQPYETVVEALKKSQVLVVSGEAGHETVKRKIAYDPTASRHGILGRSVYVKGFGEEVRSSQFDIEAYFSEHGPINAVRLRRTPDKEFKGSVFVEFQDAETAEKFLANEKRPLWKGTEKLEVKSKKEYTDGKALDIKEGRMEPSESYAPFRGGRDDSNGRGRGGRGRGRGGNNNFRGGDRGGRGGRGGGDRRDRGDRDPDDWKKRREDDRASGFKGDKKNDRRGGRGGRGGSRGGRNDRNEERENGDVKKEETSDKAVKEEKTENVDAPKAIEESATNEKKRPREDDTASEQPAKKVDTKAEPVTTKS